jgi:hypothetical protein
VEGDFIKGTVTENTAIFNPHISESLVVFLNYKIHADEVNTKDTFMFRNILIYYL